MSDAEKYRVKKARRRLFVGFALLAVLMTWLFLQARGSSPQAHYNYLQALRRMQGAEVALNSAVLAVNANVLRNYDPLNRYLSEIRAEGEVIQKLPSGLPSGLRDGLLHQLAQLRLSQQAKEVNVDRFQRANSVLRNSEQYLPFLIEDLERDALLLSSPSYRQFTRHLLAYRQGFDRRSLDQLKIELARVATLPTGSRSSVQGLKQLLRHAQVIVDRGPEVGLLVQDIVNSPRAAQLDELAKAYAEAREAELRVAGYYRLALYAISLALAAYLIYALLRIERNRVALERAHRDLGLRFEAQQRAEAELRLYARVFINAREGMTITDAHSRIVAVNPAFSKITGYQAEEVIGKTPAVLNSGRQDADYYQRMWVALATQGEWHGEIWNRRKDGAIYPESLSIVAVHDEAVQATHYIGVFSDISEHKSNEERIEHLAHHDVLTGLPNRLLLEDRISQAMLKAKRSGRILALLFIDLDRFKNINDTLGHAVGDQLLIEAAARGLAVLRDSDTLSRVGGDEFVAVLPELDGPQAAGQVARKLLLELCRPYQLAGHELTVSASAGIALFPDDGLSVSDLLRKADAAMYRAKEEGRNTFRYFSAEVTRASLGELLLENELHGALERGELEMVYEPKVDAASGRLAGAEALMRWRHREHGIIFPGVFIPLAEKMGLIHRFGEWALHDVCAQQRRWLDQGLTVVPVAVNLSPLQFAQQDIPLLVQETLDQYALPPSLLGLELTESLLMRNTGRATEILEHLRSMGVKVAIDDFGVGYSSLGYLRQFPVDTLKIDRAFVMEIDREGDQFKLASAIIAMAHELGLSVVAEGVENIAQRDYLLDHGCDQFQGYFFGRPQSAANFGRLLATGYAKQVERLSA